MGLSFNKYRLADDGELDITKWQHISFSPPASPALPAPCPLPPSLLPSTLAQKVVKLPQTDKPRFAAIQAGRGARCDRCL